MVSYQCCMLKSQIRKHASQLHLTLSSRCYRNRRIGEFLKEFEFTEGRGTGVPKIHRVLKANGSQSPIFYSDEGRSCFWITIDIHPDFLNEELTSQAQVEAQVEAQVKLTETDLRILGICQSKAIGKREILNALGYKTLSGNVKKSLRKLKDFGFIAYTIPDKPRSQNQRYTITSKGKAYLKIIE